MKFMHLLPYVINLMACGFVPNELEFALEIGGSYPCDRWSATSANLATVAFGSAGCMTQWATRLASVVGHLSKVCLRFGCSAMLMKTYLCSN